MMTSSARETILQLFRETPDGYLSGGRISEVLGVSRTAVWKQITALRSLGYQIEAVPSRGYRLLLCPDVLLAEEIRAGLDTRIIGGDIRLLEVTDSTNSQAGRLADAGVPEGLVVIADRQTAGKGRLGRSWISPPAVNLYLSVLLRPPVLPVEAPQLTFLSAVAVVRTMIEVSGLEPTVKWPNDILLNGRKIAGLLNEMNSETDRVNYVVLGIGVNLNMTADQFPSRLRYPATSLGIELGRQVSRVEFARCLLKQIDVLYDEYLRTGARPVMAAWERHCDLTGKPVVVDCQSFLVKGVMAGLDDDGALLVKTPQGTFERVLAGDVRPADLSD